MKDFVYNLIQEMQQAKEEKKIVPTHVLDVDLLNRVNQEVKDALNELYQEGKIGIDRTINNKAIFVK
ncbi:MAG: hypothetical protein ACRC9P_09515 [Bacteroides sp.]